MVNQIKRLGLALLAVLSLMAVAAVGAQAAGELRVNGNVLAEGEVAELEGTGGVYKSSIPELKLTLECQKAAITATGDNLEINGTKQAHGNKGQVLAQGCEVVGNKNCTIYPTENDLENETNPGQILGGGLATGRLLNGEHYLIATPLNESQFTTVYHGGALCTLPEVTEVAGSAALRTPNITTEATSHAVEDTNETEEKELKIMLSYGGSKLIISQAAGTGSLVGEFAGQKFSLN